MRSGGPHSPPLCFRSGHVPAGVTGRRVDADGVVDDAPPAPRRPAPVPSVEEAPAETEAAASTPVSARGVALVLVAVILAAFALRAGAAFFIPLLISLFLNYALAPLVDRFERFGIMRPIGAAFAVALVGLIFGGAVYRLYNDAGAVIEQVPPAVQRLRVALMIAQRDHTSTLEHVKRTADELEKLAKAATPEPSAPAAATTPPPRVAVPPSETAIDFRSLLLVGTSSIFIAMGQVFSALFLTFFLLCAGDLFRRKLVHVAGPSLTRRKTILSILNEVDRQNQRYFAVVLSINLAVGIATGLALYAIGLDRPDVWGIAAAVLHSIPYIGPGIVAAGAALVGYGQFGTAQAALLAGSLPIVIAGALGVGLQTWLMGRAARMNSPSVFVSLLFWGMIWGGWGLLLAVPLSVAIKTICERVEKLRPVAELLGP